MGDTGIDHKALYGRYSAQEDKDNEFNNDRRDWKDSLHRKTVHKALNIPMSPETQDDMNVENRNVTNSGLDWKHLAVIAAGGLATMGGVAATALTGLAIYTFAPEKTVSNPAPIVVQQPANNTPQAIKQDYRTQIEIRDKTTGRPIKIDWINGDGQAPPIPSTTPKTNNSPEKFIDPSPGP